PGRRRLAFAAVAAEQLVEEAARRARRRAVLRAAIVLCERDHHGAALLTTIEIAATQSLQIDIDAVKIAAHARDLAIEVNALLRLRLPGIEQKETRTLASGAAALRHHAVELGLLPAGCFLVAADL